MSTQQSQQIPIKEGFWTSPDEPGEKPRLVGSRCESCGELFFPRQAKQWCTHCQQKTLKNVELSRKGKIASFTVVMQQPGGGFYKGPVPYAYGCVDLPEGLQLETLFATDDFDKLKLGCEVELIIDMLYRDEDGNNIVTFKFEPI